MLTDWDDDLITDPEDSYAALVLSLKRKQGFGLYFAQTQCDAQQIKVKLQSQINGVVALTADTPMLYDRMVKTLAAEPGTKTLVIDGFNEMFEEYGKDCFDYTSVPAILNHLNMQRERIRDNCQVNIVLVANKRSLDFFIRRSPDFYDWRSGGYVL